MPIISIQIEVLNSKEVVEKRKGKFTKWMASLFMSEKAIRKKVEEEVYAEVVKTLQLTLPEKLKEEGINAHVTVVIKNDMTIE